MSTACLTVCVERLWENVCAPLPALIRRPRCASQVGILPREADLSCCIGFFLGCHGDCQKAVSLLRPPTAKRGRGTRCTGSIHISSLCRYAIGLPRQHRSRQHTMPGFSHVLFTSTPTFYEYECPTAGPSARDNKTHRFETCLLGDGRLDARGQGVADLRLLALSLADPPPNRPCHASTTYA